MDQAILDHGDQPVNSYIGLHRSADVLPMIASYRDELCRAMSVLAEHPRSVFMGQAVAAPGTAMSGTLEGVPLEKRVELPVFEDVQMGMAIGAALAGDLPICIYPRWNFLLLATSQLVLHLDKLPLFSGFRPRVIVRTAIASRYPMHPGPQHVGDYSEAYRSMLETVRIVVLDSARDIVPQYRAAMERDGSTVLVERSEMYA